MAPLCCSSNCKRTQGTVDLKSRFFANRDINAHVPHQFTACHSCFVSFNAPLCRKHKRPTATAPCRLYPTQNTIHRRYSFSMDFFFFFLAFVLKWGRWRTTGRFFFAFVRPVLSFWANLKFQTNVFSVNWQTHSKRSAGWNDARHLMEGWGALNINNLTCHIREYQFQGIL